MVLVTMLASWRLDRVELGAEGEYCYRHTFWDILSTLSKDWVIKYRVESVSCFTVCDSTFCLKGKKWFITKTLRVRKHFIKSPQITYTYRENIISYQSFSALFVHRWQNQHLYFGWLWKNMKSEYEIMGMENICSWFKRTIFCFTHFIL